MEFLSQVGYTVESMLEAPVKHPETAKATCNWNDLVSGELTIVDRYIKMVIFPIKNGDFPLLC